MPCSSWGSWAIVSRLISVMVVPLCWLGWRSRGSEQGALDAGRHRGHLGAGSRGGSRGGDLRTLHGRDRGRGDVAPGLDVVQPPVVAPGDEVLAAEPLAALPAGMEPGRPLEPAG